MKTIFVVVFASVLTLALMGCVNAPQDSTNQDTLFQISTLSSLVEGVYDGEMNFAELKKHGDFGLGTFNALDGEMITIDNQAYQIKADGVAYPVADEMQTPFAVVTFFDVDKATTLTESLDCTQLGTQLDSLLPTENIPYAIKVEGTFSYLKTRSVPRQEEPYPKLAEVVAGQPIFEFNEIDGVMVGFRLPNYMAETNAPGYHFHFINEKRTAGGHMLECLIEDVTVEIDHTDTWYVELPADNNFYAVDLNDDN